MNDILNDLCNLHRQATTERSHYYVASTCLRSITEIKRLRSENEQLDELYGRIIFLRAENERLNGLLEDSETNIGHLLASVNRFRSEIERLRAVLKLVEGK